MQNSAAGIYLDLATTSYAGYGNFVDFFGNAGNDYIVGTAASNFLMGGDGVDTLLGEGGDDTIVADYADIAWGNVQGGDGFDSLIYTSTEGIYFDAASRSFELVKGGSGNDTLYLSSSTYGDGVLFMGEGGNDYLQGGNGADFLIGGVGSDSFSGGYGDDFFVIDAADNWTSISGGLASLVGDTVIVEGSQGYYFGSLYQQGIEDFFGGSGGDTVYASATNSNYYHQGVYNRFDGGGGNDYMWGGSGADIYFWSRGGGYDTFVDKDYGEIRGDVVALGEGILASDVTITRSSGNIGISISGVAGGGITLSGFAAQYGPHDLLFVDNKFYDLNTISSGLLAGIAPIAPSTGGGSSGGGGSGGGGGGGGGGYDPDYHEPPIVLDLDNDGFELIAAKKSGIYFDWNGDGAKDETGWAGPDDGILVIDRDGDGDITRRDEIAFGEISGKKEPFVSDLEGLRVFDSNANSSLDRGDDAYGQFRVWRDADSDALVDSGELVSLADLGIEAMSLIGWLTGEKHNGKDNIIHATTDVVFTDGSTIKAADVLFGVDHAKAPKGMDDAMALEAGLYTVRASLNGEELPHIV